MKLRSIKERKTDTDNFEGDLRGIDGSLLTQIDPNPVLHVYFHTTNAKKVFLDLINSLDGFLVMKDDPSHLILELSSKDTFKHKTVDLVCFALSLAKHSGIYPYVSISIYLENKLKDIYSHTIKELELNGQIKHDTWLYLDRAITLFAKQSGFNFETKKEGLYLNHKEAQDHFQASLSDLSSNKVVKGVAA